MITWRLLMSLLLGCILPGTIQAQTYVLEDFESGMRVGDGNLWVQYTGEGDNGSVSISAAAEYPLAPAGSNGLRDNVTSAPRGGMYLEFHNNNGGGWDYARTKILSGGPWVLNTANHMRFRARMASTIPSAYDFTHNIELGTYVRSTGSDPTQQGDHYYHFYNLPYHNGCWYTVTMDWHPQHQVGANSNTEWGELQFPVGGATNNYFDSMTRFYFDTTWEGAGGIGNYDFDDFVFYREPSALENRNDQSNVAGCYDPVAGRTFVSWERRKDVANQQFEVKYAFSSIYASGWNAATTAPVSPVTSGPDAVYAGVLYNTTSINVGVNASLFVAMRPVGATTFRQIEIPLAAGGGDTTPPAAPTNLRVF